ncbi:bifunctional diguanylate cyclase/phosphodiesterase [Pontibacillus sp. ALD_SL1]|uniref:putative bifunctional diguanylate cyclase/phosphodiesterase n=1 Tax=Pontibacillus sp. ALD_SL1 TaxID=2777185 RepID=UPI001A966FE9|nr:bifunctional diguanylate cyclase/phosphodiesterase [Pontibacillus sp. ALD_SL1]QSS99935.1 bifunctional diguanylate cyclase/phosphodiesterase [Pontibacillus sp. ALD_SL1]
MQELLGNYDGEIVLLSIIVAVIGSYLALDSCQHITRSRREMKQIWLGVGATTMGLSIWSMHFIGMTAFNVGIPIQFNWWMTFLSILPAIGASYIAFYVLDKELVGRIRIVISAIFMGVGISSMHYIGMRAVIIPGAVMEYDLFFVYLSVIVAIVISLVALWLFKLVQLKQSLAMKGLSAILMGSGVAAMHYTGMEAVRFSVEEGTIPSGELGGNKVFLILSVSLIMSLVLSAVILLSRVESRSTMHLAYYDFLTGLPNRLHFLMKYEELLKKARNKQHKVVCILFDVDHFKWVNDSFGYKAGDKVLYQLAETITSFDKPNITIARLDGNRFGVLIRKDISYGELRVMLENIQEKVKKMTFSYEQFQFKTTLSVGASMKLFDPDCEDDLFSEAEQALHFAKDIGRNTVQIYDPSIHSNERGRFLLSEMRQAAQRNEFSLMYQPKVTASTLEVTKIEALIRWYHPSLGFISPGEFIPLAEKNGLIVTITDWVMRTAFEQLKTWEVKNIPIDRISINVSAIHFQYGNVFKMVSELISEYEIDPNKVELEITETSVMRNIEEAVNTLNQLKAFGVRIALDDFGTGLSSLNYLQRLPIDTLKIDKSFVDELVEDRKQQAIVSTIIHLAKHLGMEVTVEGVEEADQAELLLSYLCDYIQGYYYYKPMLAAEIEETCLASRKILA